MTLGDQFTWNPASEVDSAPADPGIYAWYGVPNPGRGDYAESLDDDGVDRGVRTFVEFLQRHTDRVRPPNLSVTARGGFWAEWAGSLGEIGHPRIVDALEAAVDASGPAKLREALRSEPTREVLAWGVHNAAPLAASPLYIGVAVSLRDRLSTHVAWIQKSLEAFDRTGSVPVEWRRNQFGARAVDAGFRLTTLWVGTMAFGGRVGNDELRDCAEAVEWILNRWYRPLLGER